MDWSNRMRTEWRGILIVTLLLLAAFTVPLLGPLRSSGSRVLIALAVLLVGAGLALLVDRVGSEESAPIDSTQPDSPEK